MNYRERTRDTVTGFPWALETRRVDAKFRWPRTCLGSANACDIVRNVSDEKSTGKISVSGTGAEDCIPVYEKFFLQSARTFLFFFTWNPIYGAHDCAATMESPLTASIGIQAGEKSDEKLWRVSCSTKHCGETVRNCKIFFLSVALQIPRLVKALLWKVN